MNTRTLLQPQELSWTMPRRKVRNPFLEALQHVQYGSIVIYTPEGEQLEFSAPEKGPEAYLRLYDWSPLDRLVGEGEIGFAEAYMAGKWDSPDLASLIAFALVNTSRLEKFFHGRPWYAMWIHLRYLLQGNSLSGSRRNITAHYDLGNSFYSLWLDEGMTYSCGLFEGDATRTLEAAQNAKYERILRKISARPGEHILEIGCGWGGFAEAAARKGIRVTAITLSQEQAEFARQRLMMQNLHGLATVKLMDYREVNASYDHIVSIGMFEHVGERYWPTYFETIRNALKPGGMALVQTITLDDYLFKKLHKQNGFIETYIFPGGMLPAKSSIHANATKAGLNCREVYAFGQDYVLTLKHWLSRFETHRETVRTLGYDERFLRMWRFYLSSCIASFSSHRTDVVQVALTHSAL